MSLKDFESKLTNVERKLEFISDVANIWLKLTSLLESKEGYISKYMRSVLEALRNKNHIKLLGLVGLQNRRVLCGASNNREFLKFLLDTLSYLAIACCREIPSKDESIATDSYISNIIPAVRHLFKLNRSDKEHIYYHEFSYPVGSGGIRGFMLNMFSGESTHWRKTGVFDHATIITHAGPFFLRLSPTLESHKLRQYLMLGRFDVSKALRFVNVKIYPFLRRIKVLNNFKVCQEKHTIDFSSLSISWDLIQKIVNGDSPHILSFFIIDSLTSILGLYGKLFYVVGIPIYIRGEIEYFYQCKFFGNNILFLKLILDNNKEIYVAKSGSLSDVSMNEYEAIVLLVPYSNVNGTPLVFEYCKIEQAEGAGVKAICINASTYRTFVENSLLSCEGVSLNSIQIEPQVDTCDRYKIRASRTKIKDRHRYACRICQESFETLDGLIRHILNNHYTPPVSTILNTAILRILHQAKLLKQSVIKSLDELIDKLKADPSIRYFISRKDEIGMILSEILECFSREYQHIYSLKNLKLCIIRALIKTIRDDQRSRLYLL